MEEVTTRKAGYLPAHFDICTGHCVAGETTLQAGENLSVYYSANLNNGSENAHSALYFQRDFANDLGDRAAPATLLS